MEKYLLIVVGAVVSMVFGFTGHVGKWCWEWSKRRTYAFKTKDGTKRVRIPRIIISRGVSVARVTGDGDDQDIYNGIGFLTVDVPNGIELTGKALRVLNLKPGYKFSVEVDGEPYTFLVALIHDRVLTVKNSS